MQSAAKTNIIQEEPTGFQIRVRTCSLESGDASYWRVEFLVSMWLLNVIKPKCNDTHEKVDSEWSAKSIQQ